MQRKRIHILLLTAILLASPAQAAEPRRSASLMGPLGLNTVPSARQDAAGTVRVGVGTLDPYLHSFAGMQVADWLYAGVRQSAEKSSLTSSPARLYPGLDFKITLNREGRYDPEIALGFMSAFGHKKTASEYFALSKRYNNFDFTLGMAWGRLAGKGHLSNPLKRVSSHFEGNRNPTNEVANTVHDWFTGEEVGFFGGVEYHTPIDGLSLKADWGANQYHIEEQTIDGFDAPAAWSLGLNYSPMPWVDGMIGVGGTDTVMARLSLQSNTMDWLTRPYKRTDAQPLTPRGDKADTAAMEISANENAINISAAQVEDSVATAYMQLNRHRPLAYQIGRAARHIANQAGPDVETIVIIPLRGKIAGRPVGFLRRDLEMALHQHQGSPEEIWRNTSFADTINTISAPAQPFHLDFNLALENDVSLSEDDEEYLYRTALTARTRAELPWGLFAGGDLKLNIGDNLDSLNGRDPNLDVTRSDVDAYTKRRLYLSRAYAGWRTALRDDVFLSVKGGMLEEMYAGVGGEVLYRPFGKTYAIGVEAWEVYKREPDDGWGADFDDTARLTGHINFFYEIPQSDLTAYAKAGIYLGGDTGGTLGLTHNFQNGVSLSGFVTASTQADYDTLGGATHFYSGIRMSVPLGNVPGVPEGSEITARFHPQGRDAAQTLDNPEPLYSVTEPMSYRGASRSWSRLLD